MGKLVTVKMPDIGEGVVEGEVIEWLKGVGEPLKQDEAVVVVMTDKATVELPAPHPGTLAKQYFPPGQIAIKGQPLYDIDIGGEGDALAPQRQGDEAAGGHEGKGDPKKAGAAPPFEGGGKGLATPPVRHMAKLLKIDLTGIQGTGKGGRITVDDLKASVNPAASVKAATLEGVKEEGDLEKPLIGVRRLMAEKMRASKEHIPHFSFFEAVEATRLVALRGRLRGQGQAEGVHVTFMPFFIRALSLCITKFPEINSSLEESTNKLVIHRHQHVGVAVASPQGLVVAVLRDVQDMALETLIRAYEGIKARALAGQLSPDEVKGSTITISNFGVFGGSGLWATPIINYPEAAILAVDRIQKQPLAKNNEVVARDVLNVSWSFDHRFIDGEVAAAVSGEFCRLILNPAPLLTPL